MAITPLRQRITYEKKNGVGLDGDPQYAPPVELRASVDESFKVVTDPKGNEVVASMTVTLDKLADVNADDRLTYVDENGRVRIGRVVVYQPLRIAGRVLETEVYVK